jgi:pimeloyl-ACP methyl ester carboxylesterase
MKKNISLIIAVIGLIIVLWMRMNSSSGIQTSTSTPTASQTEISKKPDVNTGTESSAAKTMKLLENLGGYPCPDSIFTCVKISVPLDHFNPADKRKIDVVFGVLPAQGKRLGMFVTADGGPGGSGLADADLFSRDYGKQIRDHFDIVFFDQRGVGKSQGVWCEKAAKEYYQKDTRSITSQDEAVLLQSAKQFVSDCEKEMGAADVLPFLGTQQAVEDLEIFRKIMGQDKFWLYGLSYGTQFAQTYTAAHADRLNSLILDGTVDLTLSPLEFYKRQAQAFNDVLVMTLESCKKDDDCRKDFKQDPLSDYDSLTANLSQSAQKFEFPLPSGKMAQRELTLTGLETAVTNYLYSERDRMILLRSLAAASQGDYVPLTRIEYLSLSLDAESLGILPDAKFSDAAFYGVECSDFNDSSLTAEERANSYLRAGDAIDTTIPRLSSVFYGDLPCSFWKNPAHPAKPQQAYIRAENIPTLVLDATADPATPYSNGFSVYKHLADGYLVTVKGGPHVVFAWGNACPDDIVTRFLVKGEPPAQRETVCEGSVTDPFIPLSPRNITAFSNSLQVMQSIEQEINLLPEYLAWDGKKSEAAGCPYGGSLSFAPGESGESFNFKNCVFLRGFIISGEGKSDGDTGSFTMDVEVSGKSTGNLTYNDDGNGAQEVSGKLDGKPINYQSQEE